MDLEGLLYTPAATVSTSEAEQPRAEHGAAVNQVNEPLNAEPLLQPSDSSQQDKKIANAQVKDVVDTDRMQYPRRS